MHQSLSRVWDIELSIVGPWNRLTPNVNCSKCGQNIARHALGIGAHRKRCHTLPPVTSEQTAFEILIVLHECTQCLEYFWSDEDWESHLQHHN